MNVPEQFYRKLVDFLILMNEKIGIRFEDTYKDVLTTSQFYTVATLNSYGPMTMTALAERMGIQKQQATKVVNLLVEMDYLMRDSDPSDRRIVKVGLTGTAESYMKTYMAENMKRIGRCFETLDENEFREFQGAVDTLIRILPKIFPKG